MRFHLLLLLNLFLYLGSAVFAQDVAAEDVTALLDRAAEHNRLGEHIQAVEAAERVLRLELEADLEIAARNQLGVALAALSKDDPSRLEPAAAAFERVVELTGGEQAAPLYALAHLRLRLEQPSVALPLFERYLELEPDGPFAQAAKLFVVNLEQQRGRTVPSFRAVTLDGREITSEELEGRVVLLDFWATWCLPCVAVLPDLERLHAELGGEDFVLLSISADQERADLERFLGERPAAWPQIWDGERALRRAFEVGEYPTYILLSREGRMIYRNTGGGLPILRELRSRVVKQVGMR